MPKQLFINTDQNIPLPAETHMVMALPSHALLSTHTHVLFAAVKAVLTHPFSPLLPTQLFPAAGKMENPSPTIHVFPGDGKVLVWAHSGGSHACTGPHTLCALTWVIHLFTCYCVALGH